MNVQIYIIIVSSLDGAEFLLFRVAPSIKFEKNEKQQPTRKTCLKKRNKKKSQKLFFKPPVPKPKNPAFENPGPSLLENNMYIVLCAYIL